MRLSDLLSELRAGILNDRSDRTAGTADYLWSDASLVRYINEAQRRFATSALVIRDGSTAEVVDVTLAAGVTEYDLHPAVIAVISAKAVVDANDLARAGHSLLSSLRPTDSWFIDPTQYNGLPPGKPLAFSTDEEVVADDAGSSSVMKMRVYPTPSADYEDAVIRMRVIRKPIDTLVPGNLSAVPEIPEDHHLEMLDWAAYLALRINDDDAGSPKRALEFRASFEAHVKAARTMVMRKLFAPAPWGFGRNGFSWEH